mmetsp:Transcript_21375/g.36431  ORF Transcript_21375/g.36431 Transcript_21375/m.36431 type:complete len:214 (-) Transcript_21375:707-1348(-)
MVQRCACDYRGSTPVHLESTYSGNKHHTVGAQPGCTTLDVHVLLKTNVRTKASLSDHVAIRPHQLQRNLIRHNGRVAMRNVGKRTRMHENGRVLQRLHECGLDGVLHQHSEGPSHTQVICSDGITRPAGADDHAPQAFAHVRQVHCQSQDSHDLGSDCNVKAGLPGLAPLLWTLASSDDTQEPVICVSDTPPSDRLWVNIQAGKAAHLFWCES